MPKFSEIKQRDNLSRHSPFEAIAQACIEAHYLPPYPGREDVSQLRTQLNRVHHGGVHAALTALSIDLMIYLYEKYQPELLVDANGNKISAEQIKLLKLAAIYHDAANTSEIMGDPKNHADLFLNDMCEIGYLVNEISLFANAIENKDGTEKNIFTRLLQSADCLEIIRVVGKHFDRTRLDVYQDLKLDPKFLVEIDQIIANHFQTARLMDSMYTTNTFHVHCEFSTNCYLSIIKALERFFIYEAIKQARAENKMLGQHVLTAPLTVSDLFNRQHSETLRNIVVSSAKTLPNDNEPDAALALYNSDGLLIRAIRHEAMDEELETLSTNSNVLEKAGLLDAVSMRRYISTQQGKVFTPEGFKWRPCTFIEQGLPIELFRSNVALIFDPRAEAGTQLSFFYKVNVASGKAAFGILNYFPEKTGKKERGSLATLRQKTHEQNKRRMGHLHDMNAHYYGRKTLKHSELLGTYQPSAVLGIVVGDLKLIKEAVLLQTKFGKPIYHYTAQTGLMRLSNETIAQYLLPQPTISEETLHNPNPEQKYFTEVNQAIESNVHLQIEQKPETQAISAENPLYYEFIHPVDPMVKCKAYMKDGEPVLQIMLRNGVTFTEKTDLLLKIVDRYFAQQASKMRQLLGTDLLQNALIFSNITIKGFTFNRSLDKSDFTLEYLINENKDGEEAKNLLLALLNIQNTDIKRMTFFNSTPESEVRKIRINDVQNINVAIIAIQNLINKCQNIAYNKITKDP